MVVMMHAYFDESGTHSKDAILWVAGYLFEADQCLRFEREWSARLAESGISIFHAVDCAHRNKEFESKSREDCDALLIDLIELIRKYAALQVTCAISQRWFDALRPTTWKAIYGDAYALGATICLQSISSWCNDNAYFGRIAYFFEENKEGQSSASRFMDFVTSHPALKTLYRHHSHIFMAKPDAVPLQAADLLAWEMNKEMVEAQNTPRKRPTRKSLLALQAVKSVRVALSAHNMPRYFAQMMEVIENAPTAKTGEEELDLPPAVDDSGATQS